jgi:hypothetical protein
MAYVTICEPCLDGRHEECVPKSGTGYGVGFCVCAHGGEESKFQRSVREDKEAQREKEST